MLMVHCGLGQSAMWRGTANHLMSRFTMTAPDLPGHGRSPDWADGPDIHDQACDALRPMLRDGIHLVGHSFGGTLVLRLALEQPDRIASLTLVEPVLFAAAPEGPVRSAHKQAEQAIWDVYATGDAYLAARLFNRIWGGGVKWDRLSDKQREQMAQRMSFVQATTASVWDDIHGLLAPGGLEALTCPVTLLRGAGTAPIVPEVHAGLAARMPNVSDQVIDGADHMLVLSHPEQVAKAVLAMSA